MANVFFNKGLVYLVGADSGYIWSSGKYQAALGISDPATEAINKDYDTIAQLKEATLGNWQELPTTSGGNPTGYSRQPVPSPFSIVEDDTTDSIHYKSGASINFGNVAAGYTIYSVLFYVRIGTSDDDNVDVPILYVNDATNLPMVTGGGAVILNITSSIFCKATQTSPSP